jgi:hypothetical protein
MGKIIRTVSIENQDIDLWQSACLHDPDNDNGRHMCIHGGGNHWVKLDGEWFGCGERSTIKTIKLIESYQTIKELRDYLELLK